MRQNRTYGVLVPILEDDNPRPQRKKNGKIEDFYDVFSFPAAWFTIVKCQGLEAGSGFKLIDVQRKELQAKQIREAVPVESTYNYTTTLKEMGIIVPNKVKHQPEYEPQVEAAHNPISYKAHVTCTECNKQWFFPKIDEESKNQGIIEEAHHTARTHTIETGHITKVEQTLESEYEAYTQTNEWTPLS